MKLDMLIVHGMQMCMKQGFALFMFNPTQREGGAEGVSHSEVTHSSSYLKACYTQTHAIMNNDYRGLYVTISREQDIVHTGMAHINLCTLIFFRYIISTFWFGCKVLGNQSSCNAIPKHML